MANSTETTIDLSGLEVLGREIEETDSQIEAKGHELWELGQRLWAFLDMYKKTREAIQKAVWAAQGLRVCSGCNKLKQASSFRYLFMEYVFVDETRELRVITALCAECYDVILEPARHGSFSKRLPAELREGEFFILWDGKFRALKEVYDETQRAEISIREEPKFLSSDLFTIGRSWETELGPGSISKIKKPSTTLSPD